MFWLDRIRIIKFTLVFSGIFVTGCAARWTNMNADEQQNASLSTQPPLSSGTDLTATPLPPAAVEKACTDFAMQKTTQTIHFPRSTENCPWDVDDNMAMHDQHYQARIEQTQAVTLPQGALICGMRLVTQTSNYYYDDEFILDFKGLVLASSADFSNTFVSEGNFVRYDWGRIKARAWNSTPMTAYCAGSERGLGSCYWPETSTNGPLTLYYDDQVIQEMTSLTSQDPNHTFRLTTTGDNDPTVDCRHDPVTISVEIRFVQ